MKCSKCQLLIPDYVSDILEGVTLREFEQHIDECRVCRKEAHLQRKMLEVFNVPDSALYTENLERATNAVKAKIAAMEPHRPRNVWPMTLRLATATLAIFVIGGIAIKHQTKKGNVTQLASHNVERTQIHRQFKPDNPLPQQKDRQQDTTRIAQQKTASPKHTRATDHGQQGQPELVASVPSYIRGGSLDPQNQTPTSAGYAGIAIPDFVVLSKLDDKLGGQAAEWLRDCIRTNNAVLNMPGDVANNDQLLRAYQRIQRLVTGSTLGSSQLNDAGRMLAEHSPIRWLIFGSINKFNDSVIVSITLVRVTASKTVVLQTQKYSRVIDPEESLHDTLQKLFESCDLGGEVQHVIDYQE